VLLLEYEQSEYQMKQIPKITTPFTESVNISLPIIMAPMFLVSNEKMMRAGMSSGIMATFPTLNYRDENELESVLVSLNTHHESVKGTGSYGVNLIVQKTNPLYKKHLEICVKHKVPFYITSLGNPVEVIEKAHLYGGKVYCDVTTMVHAEKVVSQGCDGLIAVCSGAGGHAGPNSPQVFIQALREKFPHLPVIVAGGIANGRGIAGMLMLGADGVSVGTRFIATPEADVSDQYKDEIIKADVDDIVMTDKISGTPCNIINTDYVKKIGTKQNVLERFLNNNRTTKKYFKMLTQLKGMKAVEKAAMSATYKTVYCAGQTVHLVKEVTPVEKIIERFVDEYQACIKELPKVEGHVHA